MFAVVDNMEKLTNEQLEKYYNSISLKEIKEEGQLKLLNSSVLVVGAGGLGSASLLQLASMGIGHIGVIDNDVVKLKNLPRQIIYQYDDANKSKVLTVKKRLKKINPDVEVKAYNYLLDTQNARRIIKKYDIVLDCTDNFETKFLINDICVKLKKPFVTAGVSDFKGQIMTVIPPKTRDFKSLFSELPINIEEKYKDDDGVFPFAVSIISLIASNEVAKYLLDIGELLTNQMLVVDTLAPEFKKYKV